MTPLVPRIGALVALTLASPALAQEKFTFVTNWYAQAEHGGFYQALADGGYKAAGLDVTIRMGGPQVNVMQLMAAGQADCIMGDDVQTLEVRAQGIPAVTVAASFQKDPQVLIAHPDVRRIEDIRSRTILVSSAGATTFWPWLRRKYGLSDRQMRPYTFNLQPFIANKNIVQQGYLSSEPYAIEQASGIRPRVFLLSDHGWPVYSTTIVCLEHTLQQRPEAVGRFVKATMEGWRDYLQGDASAANALIRRDNPNMTEDRIAQGIALLKSTGMVFGGDAATLGIGIVTEARMKATRDMLVDSGLLSPQVDHKAAFTDRFVKDLKILP